MVREIHDLVWSIHGSGKLIDLGFDAIKSFFAEDHWKRDKAVDIELDRKIKIGATTNSFSIEGGWDQDEKGISIWDQWVNQEHLHMSLAFSDDRIYTTFVTNINVALFGLYQVMKVWKKLEDNEQFDTHRTACDSYNHPDLDVNALKEMGAKSYKFSISWPRILPTGKNDEINHNGMFPLYVFGELGSIPGQKHS